MHVINQQTLFINYSNGINKIDNTFVYKEPKKTYCLRRTKATRNNDIIIFLTYSPPLEHSSYYQTERKT